jgi:hypothetical protein
MEHSPVSRALEQVAKEDFREKYRFQRADKSHSSITKANYRSAGTPWDDLEEDTDTDERSSASLPVVMVVVQIDPLGDQGPDPVQCVSGLLYLASIHVSASVLLASTHTRQSPQSKESCCCFSSWRCFGTSVASVRPVCTDARLRSPDRHRCQERRFLVSHMANTQRGLGPWDISSLPAVQLIPKCGAIGIFPA